MSVYDLEQAIMSCWNVVEDIDLLFEAACEEKIDLNEVSNITLGLKGLYQLRFEQLFSLYEDMLKENCKRI